MQTCCRTTLSVTPGYFGVLPVPRYHGWQQMNEWVHMGLLARGDPQHGCMKDSHQAMQRRRGTRCRPGKVSILKSWTYGRVTASSKNKPALQKQSENFRDWHVHRRLNFAATLASRSPQVVFIHLVGSSGGPAGDAPPPGQTTVDEKVSLSWPTYDAVFSIQLLRGYPVRMVIR
nr:hypothetical protein CFP56_43801 [Quercus suber]